MNARRLLLLALLPVAAWLALFGDKTPPAGSPVEVVAPTSPRRAPATERTAKAAGKLEIAALIAREQLIPGVDEARESRDLFPSLSWRPPPPPTPATSEKARAPMAPPPPFVYLGNKFEAGQWEAYLGRGEEVFIVREGMTLERNYRVKAITPSTLTLIYLPLKQSQTISIGGSPS